MSTMQYLALAEKLSFLQLVVPVAACSYRKLQTVAQILTSFDSTHSVSLHNKHQQQQHHDPVTQLKQQDETDPDDIWERRLKLQQRTGVDELREGSQRYVASARLAALRDFLGVDKLLLLLDQQLDCLEELQLHLGVISEDQLQPSKHRWQWLQLPEQTLEQQQQMEEVGQQLGIQQMPEGPARQLAMQRLRVLLQTQEPYRILGRATSGEEYLEEVQVELGIKEVPRLEPAKHPGLKLEWQTVPFASSGEEGSNCFAAHGAAGNGSSSMGADAPSAAAGVVDEPSAKRQHTGEAVPMSVASAAAASSHNVAATLPGSRGGAVPMASSKARGKKLVHFKVRDWLRRDLYVRMSSRTRFGVMFKKYALMANLVGDNMRWLWDGQRVLESSCPFDEWEEGDSLLVMLSQIGD